jgi:hypothetical protein
VRRRRSRDRAPTHASWTTNKAPRGGTPLPAVHRHDVGRAQAPDRTALDDRRYRNEAEGAARRPVGRPDAGAPRCMAGCHANGAPSALVVDFNNESSEKRQTGAVDHLATARGAGAGAAFCAVRWQASCPGVVRHHQNRTGSRWSFYNAGGLCNSVHGNQQSLPASAQPCWHAEAVVPPWRRWVEVAHKSVGDLSTRRYRASPMQDSGNGDHWRPRNPLYARREG